MSTTPEIPLRVEVTLEIPATPEQVWQAIASAEGMSGWMMPTTLDNPGPGGVIGLDMGPGGKGEGIITTWEPPYRIAYQEDWASLAGHPGAAVTPLVTEFLVEARSGGTCSVRVVTSAFGTGEDWEQDFFNDMAGGWLPMLENLRLYIARFAGRAAKSVWANVTSGGTPEGAIAAIRDALGAVAVGDAVSAPDLNGRVERITPVHMTVSVDRPFEGFVTFNAVGDGDAVSVFTQGFAFTEVDVDQVSEAWTAWLSALTGAPVS